MLRCIGKKSQEFAESVRMKKLAFGFEEKESFKPGVKK